MQIGKITNLKYYIMPSHNLCVPTVGFEPTPNCSMPMAIPEFAYCGLSIYSPVSASF